MSHEDEADGWVIIHTRGVDGEGQGFGPYPSLDIAESVAEASNCDCDKTVVAVLFPHGVYMGVQLGIEDIMPEVEATPLRKDKMN